MKAEGCFPWSGNCSANRLRQHSQHNGPSIVADASIHRLGQRTTKIDAAFHLRELLVWSSNSCKTTVLPRRLPRHCHQRNSEGPAHWTC